MLIELEKGFVKTDESPKVNNRNLDVINKNITEVSFYEFSKMLNVKTKKNIEDGSKRAKENTESVEKKNRGKYKVQFLGIFS